MGVSLAYNVGVCELVFDIVRLLFAQTVAFQRQVEGVTHIAGVAEGVSASQIHPFEDLGKHLVGSGIKGESGVLVVASKHHAEQLLQFFGVVVGKLDGDIAARLNAFVHADEFVHILGITSEDADEFALAVFKYGQQGVDGIHAKAGTIVGGKGVGLIDEKHAAHGFINSCLHVEFGISYIVAYHLFGRHFDELSCWQCTYGVENLSELACKSGLARARVAGENEMVFQQLLRHAFLSSFLDVAHDCPDLVLHALQADVVVQFLEYLFLCLGDEYFIIINVNRFDKVAVT